MVNRLEFRDIEKRLNEIYTNGSKSKITTRENMLELEKILLNKKFAKSQETEVIKLFRKKIKKFQFYYEQFETDLEIEFVKTIMKNKQIKPEKYLLYKRFTDLMKNEIKLGKISKKDKVLFIGSGPFPPTAIILNKLVGCKIDCFEKRKQYADMSRNVIKKFSLSDDIKVYNKYGQSLGNNDYGVIIIALLAKPKDKILKSIWKSALSGTRIICRTSDGIRELFYETTNESILKQYKPKKKIYAKNDQTISSVLLVK
ncbi:MAG: hypothetical protein KJ906_02225 [Nanoarchaeota archaeon]|nr:hypothetical protein [Nanoarchaeota archaeon]